MNITIPTRYRKAVYIVAVVAGGIGVLAAFIDPDLSAQVTDRLAGLGGLLSALAGVVAYLHITPSTTATAPVPVDADTSATPANDAGAGVVPDTPAAGGDDVADDDNPTDDE